MSIAKFGISKVLNEGKLHGYEKNSALEVAEGHPTVM